MTNETLATTTPQRPRTIPIIAILLVVLAVLGVISFALSVGAVGLRRVNGPGTFVNGAGPRGGAQAVPGSGGGPTFQYGPGGSFGGARTFSGNGGSFRQAGGPSVFRVLGALRFLGPALPIVRGLWIAVVIGLSLLAAWFVWRRQKRWALNLGMVLALLVLLGTLPGLFLGGGRAFSFGGFGMVLAGLNVLKAAASLPILILGMLPSVRDFFS